MQKNEESEIQNLDSDNSSSKIHEKNEEKSQQNVKEAKEKSNESEKNSLKEDLKENESNVIEKIKSFLSKIIAIQEEASKDISDETDKNDSKKEKSENEIISKNQNEEADSNDKVPQYMLEYYDLPYRYNETIVKVLAQTPKKLFVYWDISDDDRKKYIDVFGDDFFNKTYPVLLLYNEDKQYVREIPINDYANSWYINIDDPKTKYIIQLGRKFYEEPKIVNQNVFEEKNIILQTDYLPFAFSNMMEAPNDHVLIEDLPEFVLFRNVKTNEEYYKNLKDLKNIFGHNYDVEEFYKNQYNDELSFGKFDMSNPSSKLSSSVFK